MTHDLKQRLVLSFIELDFDIGDEDVTRVGAHTHACLSFQSSRHIHYTARCCVFFELRVVETTAPIPL